MVLQIDITKYFSFLLFISIANLNLFWQGPYLLYEGGISSNLDHHFTSFSSPLKWMSIKIEVLHLTNTAHSFICKTYSAFQFGQKMCKTFHTSSSPHTLLFPPLSLSFSLSFSLCYAHHDLSTVVQLRITCVGKEDHFEENIRTHTKLYFKHLTSDVRLQCQKGRQNRWFKQMCKALCSSVVMYHYVITGLNYLWILLDVKRAPNAYKLNITNC